MCNTINEVNIGQFIGFEYTSLIPQKKYTPKKTPLGAHMGAHAKVVTENII